MYHLSNTKPLFSHVPQKTTTYVRGTRELTRRRKQTPTKFRPLEKVSSAGGLQMTPLCKGDNQGRKTYAAHHRHHSTPRAKNQRPYTPQHESAGKRLRNVTLPAGIPTKHTSDSDDAGNAVPEISAAEQGPPRAPQAKNARSTPSTANTSTPPAVLLSFPERYLARTHQKDKQYSAPGIYKFSPPPTESPPSSPLPDPCTTDHSQPQPQPQPPTTPST